jgi:uncharacterized protein (DUF1800 family)
MRRILVVPLVLIAISAIPLMAQVKPAQLPPNAGQRTAAKSLAGNGKAAATKTGAARTAAAKADVLVPLTERERALQILSRFTFGARPGDVDRVLAMGVDKWFEQQLNPETINDGALEKRLAEYPTLQMTPEQALRSFPNRGMIQQVADGKMPYPDDPLLAAMYEVQGAKLNRQIDNRKPDANGNLPPGPTGAEVAAQKQQDQATAARIAGELFAMAKSDRMTALAKMPVNDRIAFADNLSGDQKTLLMAEFTPHEREIFVAMASNVGASNQIGQELAQAKMVRAILSERQLQEVMTDFWFNHFNIFIGKDADQWYTTSYERDVIRKNALGNFGDLLLATAQSPAMMVYLDNWLSVGADSLANGVNPGKPRSKAGNRGLNENYGREVMELHTVGVNGGYSQADVTNLAAILTGWTVNRPYQAGPFEFDAKRHEPGTKTWLGYRVGSGPPFVIQGSTAKVAMAAEESAIPMEEEPKEMAESIGNPSMGPAAATGAEQQAMALSNAAGNQGMEEGVEALNLLAHSPQTAHFICWKIAQRFMADDPPPALVDRMAQTFLASDGEIKAVLRTLVDSPEFNSSKYFRNKVKTPMEFLTSAYRTTLTEPSNPGALVNTMRQMGMELYHALPPTGYSITADKWMNSSALVDRLNFAVQLTNSRFANQRFDAAMVLALGLLGEDSLPVQTTSSSGSEMALRVIETTLTGGEMSSQTSLSIHAQIARKGAGSDELLNRMTALVMGSPEFQMR